MRECLICGNTNADELELQELYSDSDGNDIPEAAWICKEGKGCSQ